MSVLSDMVFLLVLLCTKRIDSFLFWIILSSIKTVALNYTTKYLNKLTTTKLVSAYRVEVRFEPEAL